MEKEELRIWYQWAERAFRVEHGVINYIIVGEVMASDKVEVSKQTVNRDWVTVFENRTYSGDAINSANVSSETDFWKRLFGITRWRYIPDPA